MKTGFVSAIKKRIFADELTKLRVKHDLWYNAFEKQDGNKVWLDGKKYLMLSSNDYLGLGYDPRVKEAARQVLDVWGTSPTGSRFANGSRYYHREIEEQLADFLGKEACHVHSAGYLSCVASVSCFVGKGDVVLIDRNVHSSLWEGVRLSMASIEKFGHNSPASLEEELSFVKADRKKMIVTEGVYSMEGHVCPLDKFVEIGQRHDCFIVLDDAHGFGVMGSHGRGTAEHFGVQDSVDIICGSFSKSLASTGGFVAGDQEVIDFLRTYSKQTIFSAAINPTQVAIAGKALEIHRQEPGHLERLWKNTRRYHALLSDLGLDYWDSQTPAVPIVAGNKERAYFFAERLKEKGVYANLIIPPGVPPGKDLIRTAMSASFSEDDMQRIEEAVTHASKALR
ncbi:MAG: pyridoxal phosphate-dependent aminotransferase family protein [Verrucomicrobia bacterium]|nr:pyridoxal phosphate-dependent aminotransferase family protein [Verrucomicrobiota bacterium]